MCAFVIYGLLISFSEIHLKQQHTKIFHQLINVGRFYIYKTIINYIIISFYVHSTQNNNNKKVNMKVKHCLSVYFTITLVSSFCRTHIHIIHSYSFFLFFWRGVQVQIPYTQLQTHTHPFTWRPSLLSLGKKKRKIHSKLMINWPGQRPKYTMMIIRLYKRKWKKKKKQATIDVYYYYYFHCKIKSIWFFGVDHG